VRRRLALLSAAVLVVTFGAAGCVGGPEEEPAPREEQVREATLQGEQKEEEEKQVLREKQQAAYYGEEFAGALTASGEPYDPYGYTAAHPHLPLGTELLVSHEGRSVRVRINDRNAHGLDLSLGAAQAIGLTEAGIAVVDVEVLS
jgi:rare lipoprotein A